MLLWKLLDHPTDWEDKRDWLRNLSKRKFCSIICYLASEERLVPLASSCVVTGGKVERVHKQNLTMATVHHQGYPLRDSLYWDETECLNYYGMLSLHEVFEVVGSQLTETDIEVLSFLLDETCSATHPLDPAGWTVEPREDNPDDSGVVPSPQLLKAWRQLKSKGSQYPFFDPKPKSGLELLLQLERRGYLSDGNLEPLLQLLRVLTRHDLLPLVSHKKRRTVSPERIGQRYNIESTELVCTSGMSSSCRQTDTPLASFTQQLGTGIYPPVAGPSTRRRRKKRGNGWSRRSKKTSRQGQPLPPPPAPHKVSCVLNRSTCVSGKLYPHTQREGENEHKSRQKLISHLELWNNDMGDDLSVALAQYNIRLRVRAEYLEHESALRSGVSSDKRQPLERQFELFSQANSLLRARDLGSIVCDIKFTELANLEAFWSDYLSGALLEALKGVFITDSLRNAAGSEGVRLLISVDQDDYEEGRRLLRAKKIMVGHPETH